MPGWAFLDVTVSCGVPFRHQFGSETSKNNKQRMLTAPPLLYRREEDHGTPSFRIKSAVSYSGTPTSSVSLKMDTDNGTEVIAGESGSISPLPTPTSTQTAVPGLSSSQAQFVSGNDSSHHSNKTAAIVGGILSGIAFIALSVTLLLWHQRIKRRRRTRKAASIILANRAVPLQEKASRSRGDELSPDAVIRDAI